MLAAGRPIIPTRERLAPAPLGGRTVAVSGGPGTEVDAERLRTLEVLVRGLSAAAKTLRLYPPTSPMPKQAVDAVLNTLHELLATETTLRLSVAREGFAVSGETIGARVPGAADLANQLRAHGVADVEFAPSVTSEEILTFLEAILRSAESLRETGGFESALAAGGVAAIKITGVSLTVADQAMPGDGEEADEFLEQLVRDSDRLSGWIAQASKSDPAAFADALAELGNAAGYDNIPNLIDTLSGVFGTLDTDAKDALIGIAKTTGEGSNLVAGMFERLPSKDIAGALCEGSSGDNLLALSSVVTKLPLGEKTDPVLGQVRALLLKEGHTPDEVSFFDRMINARSAPIPEIPLAVRDATFQELADAARVDANEIAGSRAEVDAVAAARNQKAVTTMLMLLDQQNDFAVYCRSLENLANMVPRVIESPDLELAATIIAEIKRREASANQPWPDLEDRFRDAVATASSERAMKGLLVAVQVDPGGALPAKRILQQCGDLALRTLVDTALASDDTSAIEATGELVGKRLTDILATIAPQAPSSQIATIVRHLAKAGDSRASETLDAIVRRRDVEYRKEAAKGLAGGGPAAVRYLGDLLRDEDAGVAAVAARSIGALDAPLAVGTLTKRLDEINVDGKDFALGKEIILSLGRLNDSEASETLKRLATRKALFKRGHFEEVQSLAQKILDAKAGKGSAPR